MYKSQKTGILTTSAILITAMVCVLDFSGTAQAYTLTMAPMPGSADLASAVKTEHDLQVSATSQKKKMEALLAHDIVVLIDRSKSMEKDDCPPGADRSTKGQSRWQWCCEQTRTLAEQEPAILRNHIRVVVFSTQQKVYENVTLEDVPMIFQSNPPTGGTNIAGALRRQLNDYFQRKAHPEDFTNPIKPLLIAVISDGCFDSIPIQRTIIDATQQMTAPHELAIAFLQVGKDVQGSRTLTGLDTGLGGTSRSPRFDIVRSTCFSELKKVGLTTSLLELVSDSN
jgi:hypothetical protein